MNFQDEIRQNRLERINSIYYQFNSCKSDKISKSNSIGERKEKKGGEIKKSLRDELRLKEDSLFSQKDRLISISGEIDIPPMTNSQQLLPNQWKDRITLPNSYSYSQITHHPEKASLMQSYNQSIKDLVVRSIEVKKINMIISNMHDDDTFNLPINLINKLEL